MIVYNVTTAYGSGIMVRIISALAAVSIVSVLFGQDSSHAKTPGMTKRIWASGQPDQLNSTRTDIIEQVRAYPDSMIKEFIHDEPFYVKAVIAGKYTNEFEYFFSEDVGGYECDSIVIKFHCGTCFDPFIQSILNNKYRKWKTIGTDVHLSRRWIYKYKSKWASVHILGSPKMVVHRTPDESIYGTVHLSIFKVNATEWRELTRKK